MSPHPSPNLPPARPCSANAILVFRAGIEDELVALVVENHGGFTLCPNNGDKVVKLLDLAPLPFWHNVVEGDTDVLHALRLGLRQPSECNRGRGGDGPILGNIRWLVPSDGHGHHASVREVDAVCGLSVFFVHVNLFPPCATTREPARSPPTSASVPAPATARTLSHARPGANDKPYTPMVEEASNICMYSFTMGGYV